MNKLEIAKAVIKRNFEQGGCGLFDSRNLVGDPMTTIYNRDGLTIDICYYYEYFEVFGLTDDEFKELCSFYEELKVARRDGEI